MAANCLPVVLLAAVTGATAVSAAQAAGTVDGAQAAVRAEGRVVHYDGRITQASVAAVRMLLEADGSLKELAIRSGGGDVEAGLALGGLVRDRGLDVRVVGDVCMSSCANYVFPAGRRKIVESGALVIWHGSMIQKNLLEDFDYSGVQKQLGRPPTWWERWSMKRTARQWLRRISAEQAAFYARIRSRSADNGARPAAGLRVQLDRYGRGHGEIWNRFGGGRPRLWHARLRALGRGMAAGGRPPAAARRNRTTMRDEPCC